MDTLFDCWIWKHYQCICFWDGGRLKHTWKPIQPLNHILYMWISGWPSSLAIIANKISALILSSSCGITVDDTHLLLCCSAVNKTSFCNSFSCWNVGKSFAVGVITLMGSWYTPRELAKRIAIFYSASYAASMFSGYLQAGIYKGLDGHLGLPGWRWLFIFCGIISLPASIWGVYAIPDSPYTTRARWLPEASKQLYIDRMKKIDRRAPAQLSWGKIRKTFTHWPIYTISLMLMLKDLKVANRAYSFHCLVTQPLNYFAVWLKSLNKFSVYQINLFPTAGQALGLVTTLAYAWVSDGLGGKRWQVMIVPATSNFVGMVIVASGTSYGATFFGYLINAATWGLWPVLYAWVNEICHDDAEERAIVIGVAQTLGQAFIAWVPVVILNVGKYAPQFKMGFTVMSVLSVGEFTMIFVIKWFVDRVRKRDVAAETANSGGQTGDDAQAITLKK